MTKSRDIASAIPAPSTISSAELGYLDGVTSAIQTQLDAKTAKATLTNTGDIYYASSASTPARLGIGSSAQVLTVASGVPSWATPSSGSMTSIATGSLSGSAITISSIAATYRDLRLVLTAFGLSNASMVMTLNAQSSLYKETDNYLSSTTMTTTNMEICSAFNSQSDNICVVEIYEYALSATKLIQAKSNAKAATDRTIGTRRWFMNYATAISSITITAGSGSFSAGTYTLYGVN